MRVLGPQWSRSSRALSAARGYIEGMGEEWWGGWNKGSYPLREMRERLEERVQEPTATLNTWGVTPTQDVLGRHVKGLFEHMVSGGKVDPIHVVTDYVGGDPLVTDGHHRMMAARLAGVPLRVEPFRSMR